MKLDKKQVEHIATLARLYLTETDMEIFSEQLSNILENFEILQQIDTNNIPPTSQPTDSQNIFREDQIKPSLPQDQVLKNAPQSEDGCFKVRAVLE
ncbi:MAG: Asp-tRNA(Asn)/Glu-tRNA(Gln) amidotransferase subunit GatC [Chloroflexi bacterium]|nr:Asp-tRNA(Asn)/Glu-tRNA(Gln) amidotransferase subunit GatC [Chloroflexota bacterium]